MANLLPVFVQQGELAPHQDHEEYSATRNDASVYLPAIEEICRRHDLPTDGLRKYPAGGMVVFAIGQAYAIKLFPPIWPQYTTMQARNCVRQQMQGGLGAQWLQQIPAYLERQLPQIPRNFNPVLLNTELGGFSTLTQAAGQWICSGLGDFADAFLGHSEYEFGAVGIFISQGDRALFRTFLLRYGYAPAQLTPELSNRIMTYVLLHRYSNLQWYLEEVPPAPDVETLEDLAIHFFGC